MPAVRLPAVQVQIARPLAWLSACLVAGLTFASATAQGEPRFVANWTDGTETTGAEVLNWGRGDTTPALSGQPLFRAGKTLRMLLDTTLPRTELRGACIEFHGGDRLPGRVREYVDADLLAGTPAHLIIEPDIDLGFKRVFDRSQIRVATDWVRRIVRQRSDHEGLPPRSLRLLNGASASFRALRWQSNGVNLLTEAGPQEHAFDEVAELDLGPWPAWQVWHRMVSVLSPSLESPLLRCELSDGMLLTTSLERLKPRTQRGDDPGFWLHLVQPAWSLDLLALPHRQVRRRVCLSPQELPLSLLEPSASRHHPWLSQAWNHARTDASVTGGPLRASGREFGWGFGVHAEHELEFQLPPSARKLNTWLALDPTVGNGGCARARIQRGERPLFESPPLVGAGSPLQTGALDLGRGEQPLRLIADAAITDRPRGADPLDIRDRFNWLEPLIELDPEELRREIEPFVLQGDPAFTGWVPDPGDGGNWQVVNRFDETNRRAPVFGRLLQLDGPLTLTRQIAVESPRSRAVLRLRKQGEASRLANVEIALNGRRVLRRPLTDQRGNQPLQIEIPLQTSAGGMFEISVRLDPGNKQTLIEWQGLSIEKSE